MKIILISIGTRGDMEPFLAIGELFKEKGHEVICAFPEQFRSLVEDSGLGFATLGSGFIEMLESETGKQAMGGGGSGLKKTLAIIKLARMQGTVNKEIIRKQYELVEKEQPDRIVYNGKAIYPVIWGVEHPEKTTMVSPVPYLHYVKGHTHLAFNSNFGEYLNKLTFKLADWGLIKTIMGTLKWLPSPDITQAQIEAVLDRRQVIYTISPSLVPRPDHWPENRQVLGYHERDKTVNWQPTPELLQFLERHPKIILITFGSMTNPQPRQKTELIVEMLERHNIPTIINTAAGGLQELPSYNRDLIYFVRRIPYDWVFPKMYAVIHHGGSGTTHMALKYGCASMIIPHIIDQFTWNKILHEKGLGPLGMKVGKITTATLEPKLLELVNNPAFKDAAEAMRAQMQKEDFQEALYEMILKGATSLE